jgi:hypothetical protein
MGKRESAKKLYNNRAKEKSLWAENKSHGISVVADFIL